MQLSYHLLLTLYKIEDISIYVPGIRDVIKNMDTKAEQWKTNKTLMYFRLVLSAFNIPISINFHSTTLRASFHARIAMWSSDEHY